jgi:hypothetical protein
MRLIINNESNLTNEHCLILSSLIINKLEIREHNNHRYIDTIQYQSKPYKIYGYDNGYTKSIRIKNAI